MEALKNFGKRVGTPATDFCFIISCHDMVIEMLAHLDILSFCKVPHDIIVVHSGPHDIKRLVEPAHYVHIQPKGHSLGAVLALTKGIRLARSLGIRYICFRNGDDWIMNHSRVDFLVQKLREGFRLAGYNWFGRANFDEYALNELYMDTDILENVDLDFWDNEFIAKVDKDCERHFARLIKSVVSDNKLIFKLGDRERHDGIGHAFSRLADPDNNRWFNLHWQLIGDHEDIERRKHWQRLKPLVPYADMLENKTFFKCWLDKIPIV